MTVLRIESEWTGGPSAPGLTVFHVRDAGTDVTPALTAVTSFWQLIAPSIPSGYSITVKNTADAFQESTGTLTGSSTGGVQPPTNGSGSAAHAAGVGVRIDWHTDAIVGGRRVRGRTFLVPFILAAFEANGTLTTATMSSVQNVAEGLLDDLLAAGFPLCVWKRPVAGAGGSLVDVLAPSVPDKGAFLRGRRG